MEVCTLDLHATSFRGNKFEELWAPAAAKVLDYGAKSYSFTREEEDPLHFVHISYWEDRLDFNRYWYSDELSALREKASGLHQVPIQPHWGQLLRHG